MVRLAAVADLHLRAPASLLLRRQLAELGDGVDALVVAGDITDGGRLPEAEYAADLFREVSVPVVAVLGNHDLRSVRRTAFRRTLERAGVAVLDGDVSEVTTAAGIRIGFAGVGGCGGGFWPIEGPDALPNRTLKALALRSRREATRLDAALSRLETDVRVAVMHFAPTATTLGREPSAKYWMLGNCELGRVVDRHRVDLVLHGHAHLGNPFGRTAGGTPVRNVARAVTGGVAFHDLAVPRRPRQAPFRGVALAVEA